MAEPTAAAARIVALTASPTGASTDPPAAASTDPPAAASTAPPAGKPIKPRTERVLADYFASAFWLVNADGRAYAVPGRGGAASALSWHGPEGVAIPFGAQLRRLIVRAGRLLPEATMVSRTQADTVMLVLEQQAFEAPAVDLALRFVYSAETATVAIDLGLSAGGAIVVDADGWRIRDRVDGVVFRRSHATAPLPVPHDGGQLTDLAPILALDPCSDEFRAVVGWLVSLPFCSSTRPGLLLVGPPGSGKSTRLRLATSILEPSGINALGSSFGRSPDDDQVRALHRAIPLWDNLTSVSGSASDELCRLITGTAREGRQLYSNDELSTAPIARPIGLTAVGVPAGLRPDALDRLVVLDMPPIPARLSDDVLQGRFNEAHPRLLGAVCDAVSAALRWRSAVDPPVEHRMAGHAHTLAAIDAAVAAGDLPGCPSGLLDAYMGAVTRIRQRTAAEDAFGGALLAFLEAASGAWAGKASELLGSVALHATTWNDRHAPGWPASPRRVPEVLGQLRDGLDALGITWTTTTVRGSTRYAFALRPDGGAAA